MQFLNSYLKWLGSLSKSNITLSLVFRVAEQASAKFNSKISMEITILASQLCPQAKNYPIFKTAVPGKLPTNAQLYQLNTCPVPLL